MKLTVFYQHICEAQRQTGKSLEEICALLKENGVHALEMDYADFEKAPRRLYKKLKKAGMEINCCYKHFDWGNHPESVDYKKVLRRLSHFGIKYMLAIPGFVREGQDFESYRMNMAGVLKDCCRYAKEKGVQVTMEDFDDDIAPFSKAKDLKWFMDRVPELACAFDTGNFLYQEEGALFVLPMFLDRVGYVHCKDRSFEANHPEEECKETIAGRKMYSAAVGSGVIPMAEIIKQIRDTGYDGAYAIEHFGSLQMLDDMIQSAKWLNALLGKEA